MHASARICVLCSTIEIVTTKMFKFSRIWPLSKKGGGEANDIGCGSQQQLLGTLKITNSDDHGYHGDDNGDYHGHGHHGDGDGDDYGDVDDGGYLHGGWKNWYDWEHVLERVDEVGEGEHGEGEGVDVPRHQHHLALQQDQADHLR